MEDKDVVLALLGASAGLAGLLLVFLGIVISTLQSYSSGTPSEVLRRFKVLASAIGAAFLIGVVSVALCTWWLAGSQQRGLYRVSIASFVVQLSLLVVCAVWSLITFVWTDP